MATKAEPIPFPQPNPPSSDGWEAHGQTLPADETSPRLSFETVDPSHFALRSHPPNVEEPLLTYSPKPHNAPASSRYPFQRPPAIPKRVGLSTLIKATAMWTLAGVVMMLAGTGAAYRFLLPRIYSCPESAVCGSNLDPNKPYTLSLLQTVMTYWLTIAFMISSVGLLQHTSYQAWFMAGTRGNTLINMDLALGAVKGSRLDTIKLARRRRGNPMIALLVLCQILVAASINLVVGLSIKRIALPVVSLSQQVCNNDDDDSCSSLANTQFVDSISPQRWWVQVVIPCATVVLFMATTAYTHRLSPGNRSLKDLNLIEVIEASQTDYVRSIIGKDELGKAIVRYEEGLGFVQRRNRVNDRFVVKM